MGSGSDPFRERAEAAGRLVARLGCHLLTGGGSGVMAETAKAFTETKERKGLSIGIIKGEAVRETLQGGGRGRKYVPGTVNEAVELPIYTHLPLSGTDGKNPQSRNHINVLTADILIALPGGEGTLSEVMLRLEYGSDVVLYLGEHTIAGKPAAFFEKYSSETAGSVQVAESSGQLERLLNKLIFNRY